MNKWKINPLSSMQKKFIVFSVSNHILDKVCVYIYIYIIERITVELLLISIRTRENLECVTVVIRCLSLFRRKRAAHSFECFVLNDVRSSSGWAAACCALNSLHRWAHGPILVKGLWRGPICLKRYHNDSTWQRKSRFCVQDNLVCVPAFVFTSKFLRGFQMRLEVTLKC